MYIHVNCQTFTSLLNKLKDIFEMVHLQSVECLEMQFIFGESDVLTLGVFFSL